MSENKTNFFMRPQQYVFGTIASVVTNLGLIVGLAIIPNAKLNIIISILIFALADNIADTLGVHIYSESELKDTKEVWLSTFSNFSIRLLISIIFLFFVIVFQISLAVVLSTIFALFIVIFISYTIAKKRKINPYLSVLEHVFITAIVIVISRLLAYLIINKF